MIMESTHEVLAYHEELFRSLSFRVTSLEKRMENLITLVRKPLAEGEWSPSQPSKK
jgi:hypothetical protein